MLFLSLETSVSYGRQSFSQHNTPIPFESVCEQNFVSKRVLAFYLPGDAPHVGELVVGGIGVSHYGGELVHVPLISETNLPDRRGQTRSPVHVPVACLNARSYLSEEFSQQSMCAAPS